MGLDTVELVMEIEDHFAVRLDDDRCAAVKTAGDLRDYVAELLGTARPVANKVCASAHGFYLVRRALLGEVVPSVPRSAVRPDTLLQPFFATDQGAAQWKRLQSRLAIDWPSRSLFQWIRGELVPRDATVRDLALRVAQHDASRWFRSDGVVDRNAVWDDVQEIVSEQFGVCKREITPEIRFIEDLGA
jgi:acyl carrier protein